MPIDVSPEAVEKIRNAALVAAEEHPEVFSLPVDRRRETMLADARVQPVVSIWDMPEEERAEYILKVYK